MKKCERTGCNNNAVIQVTDINTGFTIETCTQHIHETAEYIRPLKSNNGYEQIKHYEEINRNASEKAKGKEGNQVNINPSCYIARELIYQTAILKNIENMLRQHIRRGMN